MVWSIYSPAKKQVQQVTRSVCQPILYECGELLSAAFSLGVAI